MRRYDPDFAKVMHDLHLDLPDGMTIVDTPDDWWKLRPLDPRSGNFAEQLKTLRYIKDHLAQDAPIIDTIFNPFSTANKLCGKRLLEHLKVNPAAVRHGLQAIAVSLSDYAAAWIEDGGDGIFYAIDGAQYPTMSEDQYREVFLPLDNLILQSAMETGSFNVLHLHGSDIMFDLLHDLPNHVLNWSSQTTSPSLVEARGIHGGCIAGGIDEFAILSQSPSEVLDKARHSIAAAGSTGFILAPGCAVPTDTPEENLFALRQVVEIV